MIKSCGYFKKIKKFFGIVFWNLFWNSFRFTEKLKRYSRVFPDRVYPVSPLLTNTLHYCCYYVIFKNSSTKKAYFWYCHKGLREFAVHSHNCLMKDKSCRSDSSVLLRYWPQTGSQASHDTEGSASCFLFTVLRQNQSSPQFPIVQKCLSTFVNTLVKIFLYCLISSQSSY